MTILSKKQFGSMYMGQVEINQLENILEDYTLWFQYLCV